MLMPGLGAAFALGLILTAALGSARYLHFTGENTEAQRGFLICLSSYKELGELVAKPCHLTPSQDTEAGGKESLPTLDAASLG